MNHRAKTSAISVPTLIEASRAPTPPDGGAKPKVMRRPAQFSKPAARSEPAFMVDTRIDITSPNAPTNPPVTPALRAWQDDARFAFALLAIVIAVNVALSVWLAPKAAAPTAQPTAQATPLNIEPLPEVTTTAPESLIHQLNAAGASVTEQ